MVNVIKYSFFLSLFKLQDPLLQHDLKARASDIIYKSQHEIKLLKSTPSIVMASTLLEASHELFPLQFSNFRNTICSPSFLFSYDRWKSQSFEWIHKIFDSQKSSICSRMLKEIMCI